MKTLNRKITKHFFSSPSTGFESLETIWKRDLILNRKDELLPEHHLLYAILRGKDFTKGFAEVTNQNRIEFQGASKSHSIRLALTRLLHKLSIKPLADEVLEPFKNVLTPNASDLIREVVSQTGTEPYQTSERLEEVLKFKNMMYGMGLSC